MYGVHLLCFILSPSCGELLTNALLHLKRVSFSIVDVYSRQPISTDACGISDLYFNNATYAVIFRSLPALKPNGINSLSRRASASKELYIVLSSNWLIWWTLLHGKHLKSRYRYKNKKVSPLELI